jgi:hypothetical protein
MVPSIPNSLRWPVRTRQREREWRSGRGGSSTVIIDGLNQPTSHEFIGNTAYVVTLTGEIWKIDGVSAPSAERA